MRLRPTIPWFRMAPLPSAGGTGDVVGPAGGTDNALVRFDGATGKLVQDSAVILTDGPNAVLSPGTNDNAALGSGTLMWSDLFLASGAVVNFNNGNVAITHTAGILTIGTGTLKITTPTNNTTSVVTIDATQSLTNKTYNGHTFTAGSSTFTGTAAQTYTFPTTSATLARVDAANTFVGASTASAWVLTSPTITTKISPTSDDGAPLGDTTHNFSDVFLATGAVINFANGNMTITHGTATLTIAGGDIILGGGASASLFKFLEPSGSGTNFTAFKAVAQGADITYSLPPTVSAANGVLTDVAGNGVLTWVVPSASSSAITLLKANSGTSATTSANNLDTIALTGLTALDTIYIFFNISAINNTGAISSFNNSTDSKVLANINSGNAVAQNGDYGGHVMIRQEQQSSTVIWSTITNNANSATIGGDTDAVGILTARSSTVTTAWTGSWTLAFRSAGVTSGATMRWSWSVFKVAGQ